MTAGAGAVVAVPVAMLPTTESGGGAAAVPGSPRAPAHGGERVTLRCHMTGS